MPLLKRFFGNAKHTTNSRKKEDLFKIGYLFLCFFSFIIFYIINRALHYSSNSQPQDLVPFDIISIVILAITSMAMLIIGLKMRRINIPKQNMISYLYKLDIVKVLIYVIIAVTAMENQVQIHYSTEQETFASMEWLALELVTLAWLTNLSLYAKLANIFIVIFNFVYLFVRLEGYNDATLGAAFFLVKIVPITFFLYRFKTVDENLQETKIKKKEEGKVATRVLNLLPEGVAIVDHDGLQYMNNSMRAIMKVDDQQVLSVLYSLENRQFVGVVQAPGTVRKSISAMPYDIYKNSSDLFDGDSSKLSTFSKASQIDLRKLAKLSKEKPIAGSAGSMSPAKGGFTPKWKNPLENSNTPKNAPPKKKLSKLNTNGSIMLSFTPRNSPIASNIRLPAGFGEDGTKTKDEREVGTTIINNDASPSIRVERRGDTAMSSAIANITMMQRRIKRILNKIGGDPYRTSPHRNVREAIVDILGKMREEFAADAQNENQNGMKEDNLKTKFKYASRSLTFNSIPKKGESVGPSYWAVAMHSIRKTSEDRLQYLEIKFTPIISEGKPALILLVRDVTEKEIIKEMEEKERNQSAALASVSHEFRTPLNGIMGMLEHLKEHITNKVNQSYLVPAYNSAKLLMTLVNDILDFHQIKEKKLVLVPVKFNLRDKLEESLSLILLQAKARKLELKIDISPETPRIICNDPNRMQQIVNNLLGNAIKFTLEGSITIKVESYQGYKIAIKVVDTGIGIEPQNIEKLFKAFGKIDSKRNRELNPQGVGLGLTISNNLAKVLCSDPKVSGLNVTSEHLKGSTFWFVIDNIQAMNRLYDVEDDDDDFKPLNENLEELNKKYSSKDAAVSIQMTSSLPMLKETLNTKVDSPSMICDTLITESAVLIKRDQSPEIHSEDENSRMRRNVLRRTFIMNDNFNRILEGLKQSTQKTPAILIVDDTEINHMILKNFLELFSLEVDSAYNGKQALEKIKERNAQGKPYIFVLLDVEMPIMDGLECARILKKLMSEGEISSIPVIAQSGHSEEEEIQKCKNAGMTDYLVKPVTKKKLIETLVKWLPKENS